MPIKLLIGHDLLGQETNLSYSHEMKGVQQLCSELWQKFHYYSSNHYAVVVSPGATILGRELSVDVVIISQFGLGVIEIKNYQGELRFNSLHDRWFAGNYEIKAGQYMNPFEQVRQYVADIRFDLIESNFLPGMPEDWEALRFDSAIYFSNPNVDISNQNKNLSHILKREGPAWLKFDILTKEDVVTWTTEIRFEAVGGASDYYRPISWTPDDVYRIATEFFGATEWLELAALMPEPEQAIRATLPPEIITEGATDWKHLKNAYLKLKEMGYLKNLKVVFFEYEDHMGDGQLHKLCSASSQLPQLQTRIFIFDRDNPTILNKISGEQSIGYKTWGNNVFSFALPVPEHRKGENNASSLCIEFFYTDKELMTKNSDGRRLFTSSEFNNESGRHNELPLVCTDRNKFRTDRVAIIDNNVFNLDNENVALSKSKFIELIMEEKDNFVGFGVLKFREVFDVILAIVNKQGKK